MTVSLGLFGVVAVAIFAGVADALPPKKIFGGIKAAPGEFPYMVSLGYGGKHFGGGAIIGSRHVVTAAHCFEDVKPHMYSDISVATDSVFSNGGRRHAIHKLIPHPNYNSRSIDVVHDILIIETDNGNILVYNGQLVGVGSYGAPCVSGYPDVYINVYHFLGWIQKIMEE